MRKGELLVEQYMYLAWWPSLLTSSRFLASNIKLMNISECQIYYQQVQVYLFLGRLFGLLYLVIHKITAKEITLKDMKIDRHSQTRTLYFKCRTT